MTEDIPVEVDESSADPVDVPPMTDDDRTNYDTETSSAEPTDPEFKDAAAPKFDASHPPTPGLSLEYAYYLWTQLGNITSFVSSGFGMIMSFYHKILG